MSITVAQTSTAELQERARRFVDEVLIPLRGRGRDAPAGSCRPRMSSCIRREALARRLRGGSARAPSTGARAGRTCEWFLVEEQFGRSTNALSWHVPTAYNVLAHGSPEQIDRWLRPALRGELHDAYAVTEEHAGSDPSRDRDDRDADRRRLADRRREVVRHLRRRRRRLHRDGQALVDGDELRRCSSSTRDARHRGRRRPAVHAHLSARAPDAALHRRRGRARTRSIGGARRRATTCSARGSPRSGSGSRRAAAARCGGCSRRRPRGRSPRAGRRADHRPPGRRRSRWPTPPPTPRRAGCSGLEVARLVDAGADPKVVHAKASMAKLFVLARPRTAAPIAPADLRRPRLHAHERRRALLARAARRPHLGGHERDPAADRRPRARAPRRRAGAALIGPGAGCSRPRRWRSSGATERRGAYGGEALLNLARLGYEGRVYAVNPRARARCTAWPATRRSADLPEAPDAVVVAIPAADAPRGGRERGRAAAAAARWCSPRASPRRPAAPSCRTRSSARRAATSCRSAARTATGSSSLAERVALWGDMVAPRRGRAGRARLAERQRRGQRAGLAARAAAAHRRLVRQPGGARRRGLPGGAGRARRRALGRAVPRGRRRRRALVRGAGALRAARASASRC